MKVDMIASTRMRYGTRMMNAGETFQASSRDVKILEAIKKAKRAPVPAATAPEPAAPLSQEAAPAPAHELESEESLPRRRGRRRRAESNTTDSD